MHNGAAKTRTALVSGANRGIGLAIAKGLSGKKNVRALAAARREKDARAAAEGIGNGAVGGELDLAAPLAIEPQVLKIEADYGPIDILVNTAGILIPGAGLDIGPANLVESLMVNTVAPFALIRVIGPGMQARGVGTDRQRLLGLGRL
jgi:NAD(P)-dependent dehydrogenase (short-subunit alcohol dehydrogenase family)